MSLNPWKLLSSRKDKSYRIFNLRTDHVQSPRSGMSWDFYVIESGPWVNIIPLTPDREVVLVRQYRHGIRDMTLELPGGLVENGDTPLEAARKELYEETGYGAGEILPIGSVFPNPAIQNNRCYTFLAKDVFLVGDQALDEKEDIEVLRRPLTEIPNLIQSGEIDHSLVLCAFFRYFMEFDQDLLR